MSTFIDRGTMRLLPRLLLAAVLTGTLSGTAASPAAAQRLKLSMDLKELETRVRQDSNDAAAHYNVALAYWNEKRWDDAERELRTAVGIEPRFAPAHLAIAYLPFARRPKLWEEIYRKNRPDSVTAIIEASDRAERHALLIDPMVDQRIIGAVTPKKSAFWEAGDNARFYDMYYRGFDDVNEGRYDAAYNQFDRLIMAYEEAVSRRASDAPALWVWYRGLAASHIERYQDALRDFANLMNRELEEEKSDELVRVPMRTNEYRYLIATVHQRSGSADEALRLYQETIENDIGLFMAHVQRANIFEAQRRYPEAVEERQRAVNANPDDPSLLTDLGVTLGKANRLGEAEATLRQAVEANPRDSRTSFWLGLLLVQAGKRDEAKAALEHFVSLAPSRFEKQLALAKQRLAGLQ